MSDTETTEVHQPSMSGDFEKQLLDATPRQLEGTLVCFQTRNREVSGEVVEVYDSPDGTRRITIEQETGLIKAIPLWFLDGIRDTCDGTGGR